MLEYFLQASKLPAMLGKFYGRVKLGRPIGQDRLLKYVADELGTTVTFSDTVAVINVFKQAIAHYLLTGHAVNMDIFNVAFGIKGTFEDDDDVFDPARHKLRLTVTGGKDIKKIVKNNTQMIKIYRDRPQPKLRGLWDYKSKTRNDTLSPGREAKIKGEELNFDKANPDEGLFILGDGPDVKVNNDDIHTLTGQGMMFEIPETLTPGTYVLEIRKYYGSELRRGLLDELTVV